ncbi:MAG: hypothetical protein AB1502_03910 [Thermodesulfobacteriota bacterium]
MIPKNIKREHILKAIDEVKRVGVPEGRTSKKLVLEYNGRHYPPKYVISLANKHANGKELEPSEFGGGKESNDFLRILGFNIVDISSPKKLTLSRSMNIERQFHREFGMMKDVQNAKRQLKTFRKNFWKSD